MLFLRIEIWPLNCKAFFIYYRLFNLALAEVKTVTNATILILLAGIRIAATIGDKIPCTAKDNPTIL